MSMLDQLRALEQQVQQRLRELRPLVAEYRDLEKVAERLGLKRDDSEAAEAPSAKPAPRAASKAKPARSRATKPSARKSPASKRRAAARASKATPKAKPKPAAATRRAGGESSARPRTAAAPGRRQQDVLRLVRERPGITVAELATELGVDATGLYGVVRRLQSKGQISKDGTRLQPVGETTPSTDRSATPPAESSSVTPTPSTESGPDSPETPATES
jgi:transposase-like protein